MSYQPQPQMVVQQGGGGNRNVKNLPLGPDGREWSNGLCSCCDEPGTCLLAWCCPCIVYSRVKHRYEHLATKGVPDPEHGGDVCTSDCLIHAAVTSCVGLGWLFQMMNREKIRSRYSIRGGGCGDCLTACCCTPCELVQESRELELEEQSFGQTYKA
ncbi:hypothetical protein CC1G_11374 [Coprinopsis cinerea okayama7|uniref:PLAC8 family protein n=1 Tax=Coprinopsis cinerea (strain Okayama-7 / 130 / ATCC MYA-4618 / FGSC 9003) TaxID=240176 RepID=A8P8Y5_COPC7|nr:hypothetical protein CC1G_11374 [Coprinopsis cinerea okayama7\|eukprot:XP_001839663.2 hypothetical protein CC1G_11374 [Coprinopsis cinerea okayama7\